MSEVTTHLVQDRSERVLTVLRVQDCEPIIENNKRLANEPQKSESFRHVASIPNVIIEQWLIETGLPHANAEFWEFATRRIMTDPDWKWLRTA
jgi:hypothetical protein